MQKKLVHYLQSPGHSRGLFNQNVTISTISSTLPVRLQPNLIRWYNIVSWSVLWKNDFTAFTVKITVTVQNVSECLSGYLLNHRPLGIKLGVFM